MFLPVIFLSMAVLLTVFFVCLSAISENSKIHIGVVVPEKGFMERGLLAVSYTHLIPIIMKDEVWLSLKREKR